MLIRKGEDVIMNNAAFVFPAVKGIQAQREYYISMVPLEILSKIFQFVDEELPPEIRAQRVLNKSRIPEIKNYILSNPDNVLSIDSMDVIFTSGSTESNNMAIVGLLDYALETGRNHFITTSIEHL